jgi:hypothetical protein
MAAQIAGRSGGLSAQLWPRWLGPLLGAYTGRHFPFSLCRVKMGVPVFEVVTASLAAAATVKYRMTAVSGG